MSTVVREDSPSRDNQSTSTSLTCTIIPNNTNIRGGRDEGRRKKRKHNRQEKQRPPPLRKNPNRCDFFMERKNRYCNQQRSGESKFCGNHQQVDEGGLNCKRDLLKEDGDERIKIKFRIPCPIDPSHTIWNYTLQRHLKICPRAKELEKMRSLPYYKANANRGKVSDDESNCKPLGLSLEEAANLARSVLQVYLSFFPIKRFDHQEESTSVKIEDLTYEELYSAISSEQLNYAEERAGLSERLEASMVRTGGPKHLAQQGSFVGHLRKRGILPPLRSKCVPCGTKSARNFIEMGAGRGMLGLVVAGIANTSPVIIDESSAEVKDSIHGKESGTSRTSLIMVDNSGSRGKADTRLRSINVKAEGYKSTHESHDYIDLRNIEINRLKCDLADLDLEPALSKVDKSLFVIGKHVCGVATDYSLRSLENIKERISGCAIVTCCHGICNWNDYVARDYLQNAFKDCEQTMGKREFELIVKWTGGTTLNESNLRLKSSKEQKDDANEESHSSTLVTGDDTRGPSVKSIVKYLNLKCGERGLGRVCQRLIDHGRCEYMKRNLGLIKFSQIVYFVDEQVTPQNALLIGSK